MLPPTPPVDNGVARIDVAPGAPTSIVSGATTALSATAFTKDNRSLGSAGIAWVSSNDAVASVGGGVVTARLAGAAVITATSGSVSSAGVSITVIAGAATQLGIRTQPGGASSAVALTTQPVAEIRDAAGNLVTSSTAAVTVTLGSGGGALIGTATVSAVGGVASFSGLAIAGTMGARTLTFSGANLAAATSAVFNLAAGAPSQLVIATQPIAGTAYAPFTTPAVVEIRDAAGNVVPSTATVTATIASGGGTLGGTTNTNAVAGVAMFTSLTINGAAGARTIMFASADVAPVISASFNVATAPPAIITFASSLAAINAIAGQNPTAVNVAITNTGVFPLTNLRPQSITYTPLSPNGWLTAAFPTGTNAPASLRLTATSTSLPVGTYSASVVVAGDGAAVTSTLTVSLTVAPAIINSYGTAANKISIVTVGATLVPGLVTTTGGVPSTTDPTITYAARSPAIAAVDATGRITAVAPGQAWIAATSTRNNSDSVLVIVPRANGVVLRSDLSTFAYRTGDIMTVRVQVDTRGASVGAITATVTWPAYSGSSEIYGGPISFLDISSAGSALGAVSTVDQALRVIRITGASASGATGIALLATVRFKVVQAGVTSIYLNASDLLSADLANLLPTATFTQYPVIVP